MWMLKNWREVWPQGALLVIMPRSVWLLINLKRPRPPSFVSKMQPSTLQCEECSVLFLCWWIIKHTGAKTRSGGQPLELCYSKYFVTDTHYLLQPPSYQALEQTFGLLGWNQMGLGSNFIFAVQHNIYPSSGLTASPESRLRQIRRKTSQKKNEESGTSQGREHTRYYIDKKSNSQPVWRNTVSLPSPTSHSSGNM